MKNDYSIFNTGDQAVTISFGNTISLGTHTRVLGIKRWIEKNPFDGLKDIVIAYASLTVLYDAFSISQSCGATTPYNFVCNLIEQAIGNSSAPLDKKTSLKRIPVCYEEPFAPDMKEVMRELRLTFEEVVKLHIEKTYHVYMIGFLPGFAYMASVDERLRISRKETPRPNVLKGSVGLAGIQTGIYPMDSPGGWQIIGQTPLEMFSKNKEQPSLLETGDAVQFYSIPMEGFKDFNLAAP